MNFQPQSNNYYERLGIQVGASEKEIKLAFFSAVKVFPPEKEKENHKPIREAYDTLIHIQSRSEYDSRLLHGDVLIDLEAQLLEAEEAEDAKGQVSLLKKMVNLSPKVGLYRNKLGLAYLETESWDSASQQFEKASSIDAKNPVYHLNAGHALRESGMLAEAENKYLKAYELDPEDYSPPRALASLYYFDYENHQKAHEILDVAINADGKVDFQDFFCIYDKLQFYAFDVDQDSLKKQLAMVDDIVTNEDEKSFASFMLSHIASQAYEHQMFELSEQFIKKAATLTPDDENVKAFKKDIVHNAKLVKSLKVIQDSRSVHELIKYLVSTYVSRYYDVINEHEFKEQLDQAVTALENTMDIDPHATKLKKSCVYIQRNHPKVYDLNPELFEAIQESPSASRTEVKCHYCKDEFHVSKYEYGSYDCPHCHRSLNYTSSGMEAQSGGYSSGGDSSSTSGGCYIATAVYGDYEHPNVRIFRRFRDEVLLASILGRCFVRSYYLVSPTFAKRMSPDNRISRMIRVKFLNRFARLLAGSIFRNGG
ncbi:MAG: DnaJ domain-containing protein [Candidatus Marinimicrobia bacterium]|nr:DnaJ domain-containing protein [Candidatus Neomarinimicrobiota bacterium]